MYTDVKKVPLEKKMRDETDALLKLALKLEDESAKVKIMGLLVNVKEILNNGKESSFSGKS